ncbi:hypothetical protein [Methanimicrococcus blatticola]|uniref:hypothetical protein n=1 Tax=Methanimicrococcus blatticola TaxID=91560 RepID=UPI001414F271|nr:hypothetical protein [Methanimicrococcus blatticola]MBZ3935474.1 hypothetical protein [Methanimicrococcus blatticola]MCC2509117.1 hypothetical protein [Methanimicrococcus blatticola]
MKKLNKFEKIQKQMRNRAYLRKLDRSIQQFKEGKIVVKTLEELKEFEEIS